MPDAIAPMAGRCWHTPTGVAAANPAIQRSFPQPLHAPVGDCGAGRLRRRIDPTHILHPPAANRLRFSAPTRQPNGLTDVQTQNADGFGRKTQLQGSSPGVDGGRPLPGGYCLCCSTSGGRLSELGESRQSLRVIESFGVTEAAPPVTKVLDIRFMLVDPTGAKGKCVPAPPNRTHGVRRGRLLAAPRKTGNSARLFRAGKIVRPTRPAS